MDPPMWLTWESHGKNICNGLGMLQQRGEFVDMTLAADGHHVKVHQMIISLVSPFIKELITSAQCPHPVIFLNKISHQNLQSILEYAYTGEVLLPRERLGEFLEACNALHIKGLQTSPNAEIKTTNLTPYQSMQEQVQVINEINQNVEEAVEQMPQDLSPVMGNKRRKINLPEDNQYEPMYVEDSQIEDTSCDEQVTDLTKKGNSDSGGTSGPNNPGSVLQYTLSCQGCIHLILNRYIYYLRHKRKNRERLWRCKHYNRKNCPAFVRTKEDMVLERRCAHNHPFHDKDIMKRIQKGNVYTSINTVELAASQKQQELDKKYEDSRKRNKTIDNDLSSEEPEIQWL